MRIFAINYPGSFIDLPNSNTIRTQVSVLEANLADASIALDLFQKSRATLLSGANASDVPPSYKIRLPIIYAHTVLYALDAINKTIGVLAKAKDLPNADIKKAYEDYKLELPELTAVRDSAHHVEDRARKSGRKGKQIRPQAMSGGITAPIGTLSISNLDNDALTYTSEDGSQGRIQINAKSVEAAQNAIQCVLNALPWSGPSRTFP